MLSYADVSAVYYSGLTVVVDAPEPVSYRLGPPRRVTTLRDAARPRSNAAQRYSAVGGRNCNSARPRDPPPRRLKQNGAAPAPHGAAALQDERPAHRHVQAHQQGLERRPRDVKRARWGRAGREGRESAPWRRYDGGGATYERTDHERGAARRNPTRRKPFNVNPHRSTTKKRPREKSSSAPRKPRSPSGTTSTTIIS